MPNLLAFEPVQILGFVIIFARISGMMVSAPILGDRNIPPQVKIALTFILALVFYPVLTAPKIPLNPDLFYIVRMMALEVGVGVLIGFSARIVLAGVSMAGEIVGFQMGLGFANIVDPVSQQNTSLIGQIQVTFALLLLVVMDGHHLFINAVAGSYTLIPPGGLELTRPLFDNLVRLGGGIFVLSLQIGAPLIVALMAANLAIGLMARSVPQLNVIVVGFPFTIGMGLILLTLSFPFFIEAVAALHNQLEGIVRMVLRNG